MKKIIAILSVVASLLALSACSAEAGERRFENPNTPVTFTTTPVAAPAVPVVDLAGISRDAYLSVLRPATPTLTDAELLDFAGIACAALDQNDQDVYAALEQVIGQRAALTPDLSAAVIGAALGSFYCEHYFTAGG